MLQFLKVQALIATVFVVSIVKLVMLVQFWNAFAPIDVIFLGSSDIFILSQYLNALSPIINKSVGNLAIFKFLHPSNALFLISVILSAFFISSNSDKLSHAISVPLYFSPITILFSSPVELYWIIVALLLDFKFFSIFASLFIYTLIINFSLGHPENGGTHDVIYFSIICSLEPSSTSCKLVQFSNGPANIKLTLVALSVTKLLQFLKLKALIATVFVVSIVTLVIPVQFSNALVSIFLHELPIITVVIFSFAMFLLVYDVSLIAASFISNTCSLLFSSK